MGETISVRIDKPDLKEIEQLSKLEKKPRSHVLREIFNRGIKEKKLEIALEKYRKREASIGACAKIAGVPLSMFMELLIEHEIDFNYGIKELREDFEGVV